MFVALPKVMGSTLKMRILTSKKSALELNKQPIIIGDEIGIALNWFHRYATTAIGDITCRFSPRFKALSASTARLLHPI